MPFFDKARYKETVAYIKNYAASGLSQQIRDDIATLITTRINRTQDRNKYQQVVTAMSVKHNIVSDTKGNAVEREQRRAIVLIWATLGAPVGDRTNTDRRMNEGMRLAPAALPAALTESMKLAGVVASQAGADHVFNTEFSANPLTFIQTYRIFINGVTTGRDRFSTAPTGNYRNVVNTFYFYYNAEKDRFEFSMTLVGMYGAGHSFPVVSVPAVHWSDVPGRGITPTPGPPPPPDPMVVPPPPPSFAGILATELAGANWMITTQFTGCSFCYAEAGNTSYAAHIAPAGDVRKPVMSGLVLAQQLMGMDPNVGGAAFANFAHPVNVFGNGAGNANVLSGNSFYPQKSAILPTDMKWMSIFGRDNGGWQIYTQSISNGMAIMDARRIF
jgi:hypothetical protein